jgi:hypothetical protein
MNRLPLLFATALLLLPSSAARAADGVTTETPEPAAVTAAIETVRQGGLPFDLLAQCSERQRDRSLELFPGGVAIWNGRLQLTLPPAVRRGLLDVLLDHEFAAMAPSYGGKRSPQPEPPADGAGPLRVNCRITFAGGGVEKTSVQQMQGDLSPQLIALVDAVLDRVEPLAKEGGVGADDLADGLAKLARGTLAPETFSLRFVRLPPAGGDGVGSIVRVDRGTLTQRAYAPMRELGEPESDPLAADCFTALVESLRRADLGSMPANLWSQDQLDLEVHVLDRGETVLARPFSRLKAEAAEERGETQKRFDALVGFLRHELLGEEVEMGGEAMETATEE